MSIDWLGHDWAYTVGDEDNARCAACDAWLTDPEGREPCPVTEPPLDDDGPWGP